jgi:HEAT repeat protein
MREGIRGGIACVLLLLPRTATAAPLERPAETTARLIRQLEKGDPLSRQDAAEELGRTFHDKEQIIAALAKALHDRITCRPAALSLARFGPVGVQTLLNAARTIPSEHRPVLVEGLASGGRRAVPLLRDALRRNNWFRQSVGVPRPPADRVILYLPPGDYSYRQSVAIEALGRIGPDAAEAVPDLLAVLRNRKYVFSICLLIAELRIPPTSDSRKSFVVGGLNSREENLSLRGEAARALSRMGRPGVRALIDAVKCDPYRLHYPSLLRTCSCLLQLQFEFLELSPDAVHFDNWLQLCAGMVHGLPEWTALNDPPARKHAVRALGEVRRPSRDAVVALAEALDDPVREVQYVALDALTKLGADAVDAVPALVKYFRSASIGERHRNVAPVLRAIGPAAETALARDCIPLMIEVMRANRNEHVLEITCRTLSELGPLARSAGAALEELLEQEESRVHLDKAENLVWALADCDPQRLPGLLRHREANIRQKIANALKSLGPRVAGAAPELRRLLECNLRAEERVWYLSALVAVTPNDPALVPLLIRTLKQDQFVPMAATYLCEMGAKAQAAIPALRNPVRWVTKRLKPLEQRHGDLDQVAARALGRIGPKARDAISALRKLLASKSEHTVIEAAVALVRIGAPAEEPLDRLMALQQKFDGHRIDAPATWAIHELGEKARPLVPSLRKQMQAPELRRRSAAAWLLCRIDPEQRRESVAVLAANLTGDFEFAMQALHNLGELGSDAAPEIAALLQLGEFPEPTKNELPLRMTLEAMGPGAAPVVPLFVEQLHSSSPRLDRSVSLRVLRGIGAGAAPAVDALLPLLHDPDPLLRGLAAHVLGRIGAPARKAVPRLKRLFRESEDVDRPWLAFALFRLTKEKDYRTHLIREMPHSAEAARALADLGPEVWSMLPALPFRIASSQ